MVHSRCKNLQKVRPPPPSFFTMKFLYSCIMPYKLYFFFSSSEISIPKSSIEYPACGWCWCLFLAQLGKVWVKLHGQSFWRVLQMVFVATVPWAPWTRWWSPAHCCDGLSIACSASDDGSNMCEGGSRDISLYFYLHLTSNHFRSGGPRSCCQLSPGFCEKTYQAAFYVSCSLSSSERV